MKVTEVTRQVLLNRRTRRQLLAEGFEEIGEGGGKLWQLHRGSRTDHVITDVRIGPDGKTVFIRTARDESMPAPGPKFYGFAA